MKIEVSSLINEYNCTNKVFEKMKLDELLEKSAQRFGDKVGIVDKEKEVTYLINKLVIIQVSLSFLYQSL
jgi:hypothetical protein